VSPAGQRRDIVAAAGLFFAFGVLAATWVSRIPAVQADLHLDATRLGLALLGLPIGAVVASVLVPRLLHRNGRQVIIAAMPVAAATLALPGLARNLGALSATLAAFGAATGALDVSLNTHASQLERSVSRSIFGRLHGMWSLGALVGAGAGTAAAAGDVSPRMQFIGTAVAVALATGPLLPLVGRDEAVVEVAPPTARGWSRNPGVVVFAVAASAGLIVEVAAADWGGVFVRTVIGGSAAASAAPFAVFAGLHLTVRVIGDRFVRRDARRSLLSVALASATVGMVLLAVSTTTAVAYLSLAIVGAGVSLVFPVALAGAGQIAGVSSASGVATAAGSSYIGWAATPPLIGVLAGAVGLRATLLVPAAVAMAGVLALRRRPQ
jgi:MFS family permease